MITTGRSLLHACIRLDANDLSPPTQPHGSSLPTRTELHSLSDPFQPTCTLAQSLVRVGRLRHDVARCARSCGSVPLCGRTALMWGAPLHLAVPHVLLPLAAAAVCDLGPWCGWVHPAAGTA
eukprot:4060088-Pyramimonas_sp.AAC.2